MKIRNDLKTPDSPEDIEIIQLTEESIPSSHVYMEAQIFTPDSKRFILHRSAHPHGSDKHDPEHKYLVCDVENGCELAPVTHETGATAPSVSPDGEYLYYFVNEIEIDGGRLTLKRVRLDGTGREEVMVLDSPLWETKTWASKIYPLSTISSDGKRLATGCFIGDGKTENASFGLLVFDVEKYEISLPLFGPSWCNIHPQYCRSRNEQESRDILVQENHGNVHDTFGNVDRLVGGAGADIHVIKDDGTGFRDMPWGRDETEFCRGHQCWRGRMGVAITSTVTKFGGQVDARLIQGKPEEQPGHLGMNIPSAYRNDLTSQVDMPHFDHFGTDISGRKLITDGSIGVPQKHKRNVYVADLPKAEDGVLENLTFLLDTKSSCGKNAHLHPFLSPDGSLGFFNSDESGLLQAYMIRRLC